MILLISLATAMAILIGLGYEQYHWNQQQRRRTQVLELRVTVLTNMLMRIPEMRQAIAEAPSEAFQFHKLH